MAAPIANIFNGNHGQPSARLAALFSIRDALTDLLLSPEGASPLRLLGMTVPPTVGEVNGVAIHRPIGDAPAELAIFAATEQSGVGAFVEPLRQAGLTVRVMPGVSFNASARPVQGGGSLGHGSSGGAAGTMGCVVKSRVTGDEFALTCNHVIADLNRAAKGSTEVWEPASGRWGSRRLGVVEDFADIDFTPGAYNVLDAALARPDSPGDIVAGVGGIGALSGINVSPGFGDAMKKQGVATRRTDGTYQYDINARVAFANGSFALFRDMLGIVGSGRDFAALGDSGAVAVDDGNAVVGMVVSVASGINLTMATRIEPILNHFQVDVV
jgi:hypothetical protein